MLSFLPCPAAKHPVSLCWRSVRPTVLRIATAFASESGVQQLSELIGPSSFEAARIDALVGIHDGVTHPEALRRLARLPRGRVRIPYGGEVLAAPALKASAFFHPKIYCMQNESDGRTAIISTSANLTFQGLISNVEQVLVWEGASAAKEVRSFNAWWRDTWNTADVATDDFINAYERIRPRLPTPSRALGHEPEPADLQRASELWVELTRRPEGGSFNQLELLFNAHYFFFPSSPPQSELSSTLEDVEGRQYSDRRLVFHGPPAKPSGNHMWRVYLPTAHQGLVGYQDGDAVVHFTRTAVPDHYVIRVAPSRGSQALSWLESGGVSRKNGTPPRRMGWR